jgi:hypothetical protein
MSVRMVRPAGGLGTGGAGCDHASASASAAAVRPGDGLARVAMIASASGAKAIVPRASHADAGSARPAADISAAHASAASMQILIPSSIDGSASRELDGDVRKALAKTR